MPNLSTRDAEYMIAIEEEGSLSRAAERMFVTQPSLTQSIKKIEAEFGVRIFVRDSGRMRPTYAGARFLDACRKMVKTVRDAESELADLRGEKRGQVLIGMPFNLTCTFFPMLCAECLREMPGVDVIPREGRSHELIALTSDGTLDMTFCPKPAVIPPDLESEPIMDSRLILSAPSDDPICKNAYRVEGDSLLHIDISLANGRPFIMNIAGQRTHAAEKNILDEAGVRPRVVFMTKNVETKMRMTAAGLGLSIFPEHYLRFVTLPSGSTHFAIAGSSLTSWPIVELRKRDGYYSHAAAACAEIVRRLFKK